MKQYQSFEDIETELKHLDLERKIAWEELKFLKNEFQEDLKPANWIQYALKSAGKYGLFLLAKRFFK
ncbi:hypothetical protein [Xanthomarina sp. F2636L]|uniref:hypothetical protein n=1 Tax=Xanthomarina sp. F2636L TaxID=2996018 RepID=UPI00225E697A|nr:hypothetical protein [Xanthomarina sp. F2636L]MCX7550068.1 hypothetical protein [Xanthomarina sp. F2636L]